MTGKISLPLPGGYALVKESNDCWWMVAEMKPVRYHGRDGAHRGLLLINDLACLLRIAIEERESIR